MGGGGGQKAGVGRGRLSAISLQAGAGCNRGGRVDTSWIWCVAVVVPPRGCMHGSKQHPVPGACMTGSAGPSPPVLNPRHTSDHTKTPAATPLHMNHVHGPDPALCPMLPTRPNHIPPLLPPPHPQAHRLILLDPKTSNVPPFHATAPSPPTPPHPPLLPVAPGAARCRPPPPAAPAPPLLTSPSAQQHRAPTRTQPPAAR